MLPAKQETLAIWEDKAQIKEIYGKDLSNKEFDIFMQMGIALGANPFTREIWAVKYGNSPAQIFCGRDFYRRKGQEQPDYLNHLTEAIYNKDEFKMVNGEVQHSYNLMDRGSLIGAYIQIWRKGIPKPFFHSVKFSEYNTNQSLWKSKPETMIKKVAEAQGFRSAYQGVFRGTYDESELWVNVDDPITQAYQINPITGNRNPQKFPESGTTNYHYKGETYYFGYDGKWHTDPEMAKLDPVTGADYVELEEGDAIIYESPSAALDTAQPTPKPPQQKPTSEAAAPPPANGGVTADITDVFLADVESLFIDSQEVVPILIKEKRTVEEYVTAIHHIGRWLVADDVVRLQKYYNYVTHGYANDRLEAETMKAGSAKAAFEIAIVQLKNHINSIKLNKVKEMV